jgi:hypothetical protein
LISISARGPNVMLQGGWTTIDRGPAPMRRGLATVAALSLAAGMLAAAPTGGAYAQEPPIYGSQLMTEQERAEYRIRLGNAASEEERQRIRLEHHAEMQKRAQAMGVVLPDEPPAPGRGMGQGMGQGMGRGMGQGGGGMGQPMRRGQGG